MTSGSERRRRQQRVTIRLSAQELEQLEQDATRAGVSLSSFARYALVRVKPPRSARRPPIEKELLAKTLGQLGKIGSNVNQIARVLNASGPLNGQAPALEFEIRRTAAELMGLRNAVMQALGRRTTDDHQR